MFWLTNHRNMTRTLQPSAHFYLIAFIFLFSKSYLKTHLPLSTVPINTSTHRSPELNNLFVTSIDHCATDGKELHDFCHHHLIKRFCSSCENNRTLLTSITTALDVRPFEEHEEAKEKSQAKQRTTIMIMTSLRY